MKDDELIRELISTVKPLFNNKNLDQSLRLIVLLRGCFRNISTAQTFTFFIENGTANSWLLQNHLGMPEATVFRNLKLLRSLHLIELVIQIPRRKGRKGGPIPKIWGLIDNYTQQDIAETMNLYYQTISPKYKFAEQLAQSMKEEAERNHQIEIRHTEIITQVRSTQLPFNLIDIIQLTTQYLHDQGIRILY